MKWIVILALSFQHNSVIAQTKPASTLLSLPAFDFEGHRGARGLAPENTIPSFLKALSFGVTTLEMDVVITKDRQVVLSHEPYLSSEICSDSFGNPILKEHEMSFNIYHMTYQELSRFDCGKRGHPRFPSQEALPISKPLLSDVIQQVEQARKEKGLPAVFYNIETKSDKLTDGIYHPFPDEFASLLYHEVKSLDILNRTIFQSFDERTLESLKKIDPNIYTCLLVENQESLEKNLQRLSFLPNIYSPYYKLVTPELIIEAHNKNLKVIVWTVNTKEEMIHMISLGVDGIITDYPNLKP